VKYILNATIATVFAAGSTFDLPPSTLLLKKKAEIIGDS
jgi:hypothetical protein